MPARVRFVLIGLSLTSALALVAAVVALRSSADETEPTSRTFAGALMPEGVPVPPFSLRDQDGNVADLAQFKGRPFIVTFVYATCTESCGPQLQMVRGALDDLGRDVPVLAFSAEPRQDTPRRARAFLLEQRMTGRARFMLGSPRQLEPIYDGFFVQPQTDEQEHHARIVLVDRDGFQRVGYNLENSTSDDIEHDLRLIARQ